VHQRRVTPRPRVRGKRSEAKRSNERRALDVTISQADRTDGPTWPRRLTVTIARWWATSSRCGAGEGGRACLGGGVHPALWNAETFWSHPSREKRQWADLSEPAVSWSLPLVSTTAGVYHAVHAGAERDRRALLPQPEGAVRLATPVQKFRRSTTRNWLLDSLLQPATSTPIARLPEPGRISGSTTAASGLTTGVHYR